MGADIFIFSSHYNIGKSESKKIHIISLRLTSVQIYSYLNK